MNIYIHKNFLGHYPVGTAAVVVAENAIHAASLLEIELKERGLRQEIPHTEMVKLETENAGAMVLCDGNY